MKLIKCKVCKKEFEFRTVDKRDKNKYCSSACSLVPLRTKKHQIEAGKKGAKVNIEKYRGTGTKTYVKENGRHQHRVIAELMLGRKLKKGEIVHHKDHNKKNNHPSNLEVTTQSEHCKIHFKKHGPLCLSCDKPNRKGYAYCSMHQTRIDRQKI